MGVPCPGCGRQYDVTLFGFGRTIHCSCGTRVGLEARVRARSAPEPRFAADAMLGRLARWLRMLGFDVFWAEHVADEALVRRALEEGRTILTRDRRLPEEWRVADLHLVEAEGTLEQLREVVQRFALTGSFRLFTRCSRCNARLQPAAPGELEGRVPARVLERADDFARCPGCDRIYWEGSHTARIRRVAAALAGSDSQAGR